MADGQPAPEPMTMRDKLMREGKMFFLFGIVGAIAFVIDAVILKIGLSMGLDRVLARIISITIGMHFTFAVNRIWAFKAMRGQPLIQQWAAYVMSNIAGASVNYATFLLLTQPGAWLQDAPVLGVAAGSIAGMFVNFGGARLLAFRR
jgi:putative flippase GtrA